MDVTPGPPASMVCIEMQAIGEASETESVCFVCMEPSDRESQCKCTDRHVHPECLLKWLQTKKSTRCEVCLEQHSNVAVLIRTSRSPSLPCCATLLSCVCFVTLLTGGSVLLAMYQNPDDVSANIILGLGIMMTVMSLLFLFLCFLCGSIFKLEQWRVWQTVRRVVMRVL